MYKKNEATKLGDCYIEDASGSRWQEYEYNNSKVYKIPRYFIYVYVWLCPLEVLGLQWY